MQTNFDFSSATKIILKNTPTYLIQMPVTLLTATVCLVAYLVPSSFRIFHLELGSRVEWPISGILGCHLLHWNFDHLFWDLGMFIALGAISERSIRLRYYWTLLISAVLIPFAVAVAHPEISSYRGLSGLDSAIFSLLIVHRMIELRSSGSGRWWPFAIVGCLLCAKILYEFFSGTTLFVQDTSFIPIPVAHVAGAVVGLLMGLPFDPLRKLPGITQFSTKDRISCVSRTTSLTTGTGPV